MNDVREINRILKEAFTPEILQVQDESGSHTGHLGFSKGEGTHFAVTIVSVKFEGMPLLERHRKIYEVLKNEMDAGIHALALRPYTPQEWQKNKGVY